MGAIQCEWPTRLQPKDFSQTQPCYPSGAPTHLMPSVIKILGTPGSPYSPEKWGPLTFSELQVQSLGWVSATAFQQSTKA